MSDESIISNIINPSAAIVQPIDFSEAIRNNIEVDMLRLDLIHPVISGNKYFKLKYPVLKAVHDGYKGVMSFGGAWSNHLVALAAICRELGFESQGMVRGEAEAELSPTLQEARSYGMQLRFLNREEYRLKKSAAESSDSPSKDYLLIPEGGCSTEGVKGAAEIVQIGDWRKYTHIVCAIGTGTMFAGILSAIDPKQQMLGISALKMPPGNDVEAFIRQSVPDRSFKINYDYHFGGFAKKTPELIDFMNSTWNDLRVPTDFVYNAKMMFAIRDLLSKNYFSVHSRILAIHSGGLQGNRSISDLLDY